MQIFRKSTNAMCRASRGENSMAKRSKRTQIKTKDM